MSKSDPRTHGAHELPKGGVIGAGGGKREHHTLPNKDVSRDPKKGGKTAVWKTGKTG